MTLKTLFSGGQSGADQGGLAAAVQLGLGTGGWVPYGWRTEEGPRADLAQLGLREHTSSSYPPRTALNIQETDGTLIFGDPDSAGSKLTADLARREKKPCLTVSWQSGKPLPDPAAFKMWLMVNRVEKLNVAGNRESVNPGVHDAVRDFLLAAIGEIVTRSASSVASSAFPGDAIDSFKDAHSFLSNFFESSAILDDVVYPTAEHAYQAAKTLDPAERVKIRKVSSPGRAKKVGRALALRRDWEEVKVDVMRQIVLSKFLRSRKLAKLLIETGERELVEGNRWNDTFWGVCRGNGENHLGKILMWVRGVLNGTHPLTWYGTKKEADDIRMVSRIPQVSTGRPKRRYIAFDTETYLIIPGLLAPRVVCLTYCTEQGETGILNREQAAKWLHEVLDEGATLIGQNAAYDIACLCVVDESLIPKVMRAYDEGRIEDTYIREKLLMLAIGQLADEGDSGAKRQIKFGLEAIVKRRFNRDLSAEKGGEDAWRFRYRELDGTPIAQWPEKAVNYALDDGRWTMAVYLAQEAEAQGAIPDALPQTRAALWLHLMGVWGVRTDPERVFALEESVRTEYACINEAMKEWELLRPQMKKGKQVWTRNMAAIKDLIVQAYSGDASVPLPRTPSGAVSTSRATLLNSPHPHMEGCVYDAEEDKWDCENKCLVGVLHMMGRRSGVEKLLTTFIPALLLGTQVPINPRWNELVATGRTSCMKPNLQQPPRKGGVRECFVPRPGFLYASADYSFVELCTLAQVCIDLYGFSRLADAINAGLDPHLDMAAELMGVSYAEATAIRADKTHVRHEEVKEQRQLSKCFHPDTEVLTRTGWRRISDLAEGEEVIVAEPRDGGAVELGWQVPTKLWSRHHEGALVHLKNEGIDLRVTPDHRMLAFKFDAKKRAVSSPKVVTPEEMAKVRYWPNAGQFAEGEWDADERLLRLAVATQADGTYSRGGRQIRFGFSKQRKIDRLLSLLLPGEYRMGMTSQGVTEVVIHQGLADQVKALLDSDKAFPWSWLSLTLDLREAVLDEFRHWNGHRASNWTVSAFYSTVPKNVDVLQALATLSGRKTRAAVSSDGNPDHLPCHQLSVKDHHLTRGGNLEVTRIPYSGEVVCLTVPTSFVLVRDGGIPVITGQCLNFGLPGGLGAEKFVAYAQAGYGVTISVERARQLKPIWQAKWPEVVRFHQDIGNRTKFGKSFTLEQLRSGRLRGDCGFCDSANSFFQGMAADGAKKAGWLIAKECYLDDPYRDGRGRTALFGSRMVMFLHDEFILEVPKDRAAAAAERLAERMIVGMKEMVPDVSIFVDPALMYRWLKGAESVYVDGQLVPWEPERRAA